MAATNKSPWIKNLSGILKPLIFPGKVQAGATQAIKRGEICTFNETSGYFVPADAVADRAYALAIANEEQKSTDLERYVEFLALRPDDVFEFPLDAAAQIALGDALTLTASDSQKLTRDVDGAGVAFVINVDNYPETGTTLLYRSYAQVVFNPVYSYWCQTVLKAGLKKVLAKTSAYTLVPEDLGTIFTNKGASGSVTLTGPSGTVPVGWYFDMAVMADQAFVFDPKPDTACCYIKGAAQGAGKYVSVTDIGDYIRLVWDGTDWLATLSISGADADITVEG